jgi:hypothetical protein
VCQFYTSTPKYGPAFVAVNFQSGIYRELLAGGVSKIVAGFGRWFVASIPYGPMLDGQSVPQMNVRAFGPGGAMAWFPWNGTGLIYRDASVRDVTLSTTLGPEDPIQLIDGGVVWAEGGRVHSWNLPQFPVNPVVVPGGFGWLKAVRIGGVYYLAYQSYALASVVFHPANELVGYRWPAPLAYRLDAGLLNDVRPRLVWSASDADDPAHIVVNDVDLSLPRIALGACACSCPYSCSCACACSGAKANASQNRSDAGARSGDRASALRATRRSRGRRRRSAARAANACL